VPKEPDAGAPLTEFAPEQVSTYFLDLEGALGRVDSATTYYQVLGIERGDGQEKIKSSFNQLLDLLFPPYSIGRTMPAEMGARMERAFTRASEAFAVLADFSRRKNYDATLLSPANRQAVDMTTRPPVNPTKSVSASNTPRSVGSSVAADSDQLNLRRIPQRGEVYSELSRAKAGNNRRRVERFKLSIPARITGHDRTGKWHEMAETIDVSRTGLKLRLRKRVATGTVLYITVPLPAKLRSHGFAEQSYNVYALIRRVEPSRQGVRAVGVEFIGEHPPAGFLEKPWAVFRAKRTRSNECRRPNREEQIERVALEYFDDGMRSLGKEEARTENVSSDGLRISGTKAPPEFDLVRVSCANLKFESMAALRSRYKGNDGLERICVQLIDNSWPVRD
jgi:hypothetical protein